MPVVDTCPETEEIRRITTDERIESGQIEKIVWTLLETNTERIEKTLPSIVSSSFRAATCKLKE
jgi:hypothetical protein